MKNLPMIMFGCLFLLGVSYAVSFAQQSDSPLLEHIKNPPPEVKTPEVTSADGGDASAGMDLPAGAGAGERVFVLPVRGMISDVILESIQRRVEMAREKGVDVVVFEMDTWGGLVTSALDICDYIKGLDDVHTIAWVHPKAISAGAMIAVACDEIVVGGRARFGDCAPISIGGDSMGETERSKATSPILEEFRDSATRNDYPVALCEAMVQLGDAVYEVRNTETDELLYVYGDDLAEYGVSKNTLNPGVKNPGAPSAPEEKASETRKGKKGRKNKETAESGIETIYELVKMVNAKDTLLTISQDETLAYGFATAKVEDDAELAAHTEAAGEVVERYEITWSEDMVNWLTNPMIRSGLLMVAMICGYMELQAPGLGLPGALAVAALSVFVGAPYLAGLAGVADVLLIGVGIILIMVEVFVLPGFGVAGLGGVLCLMVGAMMTFVQSEPGGPDAPWLPELEGTWDMLDQGMMSMTVASVVSLVGMYYLTKHFGSIPLFKGMRMQEVPAVGGEGVVGVVEVGGVAGVADAAVKLGEAGVAMTDLHPVGRGRFGDRIVDVMSEGGWIEAGKKVRVIEVSGTQVVVKEIE